MRKSLLLSASLIALAVISTQVQATVWRVNATPGSSAHYSSLQAAHDAASTVNGDTIYLEGSPFSTGGLTCSKVLTIIGAGYFLDQNPQTQANLNPSKIDSYTYFQSGSEGSKIMGCYFTYPLYLYVGNISIERNYFSTGQYMVYAYYADVNNVRIINNYFDNVYYYHSIYFPNASSNILISNNYINGYITTGAGFSGFITNNILGYSGTFYNSTLTNNIMIDGTVTASNCNITYNIGNSTQFGNQNGNQQNVNMTTVFVGATGNSTDGQWQLKTGSPAIGAGEGGVDCGIYGGAYPYRLSGLPPIPAVYYFNAPSLPTNNIQVSLKAKSHN